MKNRVLSRVFIGADSHLSGKANYCIAVLLLLLSSSETPVSTPAMAYANTTYTKVVFIGNHMQRILLLKILLVGFFVQFPLCRSVIILISKLLCGEDLLVFNGSPGLHRQEDAEQHGPEQEETVLQAQEAIHHGIPIPWATWKSQLLTCSFSGAD